MGARSTLEEASVANEQGWLVLLERSPGDGGAAVLSQGLYYVYWSLLVFTGLSPRGWDLLAIIAATGPQLLRTVNLDSSIPSAIITASPDEIHGFSSVNRALLAFRWVLAQTREGRAPEIFTVYI